MNVSVVHPVPIMPTVTTTMGAMIVAVIMGSLEMVTPTVKVRTCGTYVGMSEDEKYWGGGGGANLTNLSNYWIEYA